ncbi:MAG: phosphoesterase [Saprospirales bacterium]|nr:phosphoesterase [Saprospirales bacterium]|tara:strand:- start:455 stop:1096 length:642 start_codon:yes stop_codon:yes gene_type:complete
MRITWHKHNWTLDGERALYWPLRDTLILGDLHFGRSSHFQRAGIALTEETHRKDLLRLKRLLEKYKPSTVYFLGDLFHSEYNAAWQSFSNLIMSFYAIKFVLIQGNHDILYRSNYEKAGIEVLPFIQEEGLLFNHEPIEEASGHGVLCAHIHPGIIMRGKAKQRLKLPCFYVEEDQMILPAFTLLAGMKVLRPQRNVRVYLPMGESVQEVTRT